MEMKKSSNDVTELGQEGKEVFLEIKDFVYSTKHGVALIDKDECEKIYTKENIDNLFKVINENNINEVEYIQNDFMSLETANDTIVGFNIILINGDKYTIEVL